MACGLLLQLIHKKKRRAILPLVLGWIGLRLTYSRNEQHKSHATIKMIRNRA